MIVLETSKTQPVFTLVRVELFKETRTHPRLEVVTRIHSTIECLT